MPIQPSDVQRFLEPDFLGDLESRPFDEVRATRAALQQAEMALSYVRRLVQGRLDIVEAERRGRAEGEDARWEDPVQRLPEILGDTTRPAGPGRLPMQIDPGDEASELVAELDRAVDPSRLTDLGALSESELDEVAQQLRDVEREVSGQRRALHEMLDALQAELVRRYRSGEASVEALLT